MNLQEICPLPSPEEIRALYPLPEALRLEKQARDQEAARILTGEDDRLLLIIGPCSADRPDAVLDYMTRLRRLQQRVAEKILIIPRNYTNKPRTSGEGYMGLLHQPDPQGESDLRRGVLSTRELHLRVLRETGFACADELLYPEHLPYTEDLLGYVAVGARSVENQQHRLVASGLNIPVGMKNPTSGDFSVMLNAISAAQHGHFFAFRGWEVRSSGNALAHAVLRGSVNRHGQSQPNYHYEDLLRLREQYLPRGLRFPAVLIDCNHANSGKKYLEQVRIAKEILHSKRHSKDIDSLVKGMMIESYIEDGNQKISECTYGKSITDACLGWEKSERLILDLADLL